MQLPLLCDTAIQVQKHWDEERQACCFALFLPSTISWKCSWQHACLPKFVQSAGCGWLWLVALSSLGLTAFSQSWVIHLQETSIKHEHPEFLLISHPLTLVTLPFSVYVPLVLLTFLNQGCPFWILFLCFLFSLRLEESGHWGAFLVALIWICYPFVLWL